MNLPQIEYQKDTIQDFMTKTKRRAESQQILIVECQSGIWSSSRPYTNRYFLQLRVSGR